MMFFFWTIHACAQMHIEAPAKAERTHLGLMYADTQSTLETQCKTLRHTTDATQKSHDFLHAHMNHEVANFGL